MSPNLSLHLLVKDRERDMLVIDLKTLSNNNLKKLVANYISLDDVHDECGACSRPTLLHKEGAGTWTEKEP